MGLVPFYKHDGSEAPAIDHEFDADGNLESAGTWIYTWNAGNRLKAIESSASVSLADRRRLEFKYDSDGRRYEKKVSTTTNGTDWNEIETVTFIWNGYPLSLWLSATRLSSPELWRNKSDGCLSRLEARMLIEKPR